jgi:tetratricopeptide (TPR) repeat protein
MVVPRVEQAAMRHNLRELSELLRDGLKRSMQGSYERRAPAKAALPYLRFARRGLRVLVEELPDDARAWRLLSEAEEALLDYRSACAALEKALSLEAKRSTKSLKRLYLLREYEAKWEALGLTPEQLAELGRYLEQRLAASSCDHTMAHTDIWLGQLGIADPGSLKEALEHRGAYCDCEVLFNVARA